MLALDVNVLVDAFREDSPLHREVASWLRDALAADEPVAVADVVVSGFLRVVTHPRVFDPATPLERALEFVSALRQQPRYLPLAAGNRHWEIFQRLCREVGARGNLVADAYLAALAIESGCTWVSSDRQFSRFTRLRWQLPGA